ncbi:MAG TPA: Uma2 family endonuclease [Gemmata sp.]|jgi:Uma2 family endonuclease|nr:Uma2 family endonuclease [Gemmata sp.]
MDASQTSTLDEVVYPESDGKPRADNTLQWDWMVKIVGELREMLAGQNVFVAGHLFWYPVKGSSTAQAPDALVVFGRPPGYRGSYKQWEEDGIAPQVVFEILSPSNSREEMDEKLRWYDRHGVEEYYLIDPDKNQLNGWVRCNDNLTPVYAIDGFISPRLKIRFAVNGEVVLYTPDGREFQTREKRIEELQERLRKVKLALRNAQEAARTDRERSGKDLLAAKLRELGINPDDILTSAS